MSNIDIRHSHDKSLPEAKAAVERVAQKMTQKFEVECSWSGNTLEFQRSGVNGRISLCQGEVRITAQLGFLLMALKGPIENEIHQVLAREFG